MPISGSDFETLVKPFFKDLFEQMGFTVLEVRKQQAGDQKGFDIFISFLDDNGEERHFFIECKYYTTVKLDWSEIFYKQMQLEASAYEPTAFIALSPLCNLSNIDHNIQASAVKKFKYPVDFWTPDKDVNQLFALDEELYKKVYDVDTCDIVIDREKEKCRIKALVNLLIQSKDAKRFAEIITIAEAQKDPDEAPELRTALDEKLNALLPADDENRIRFHRIRANYKVYIEDLNDVDPELRAQILQWESDLRVKASRLTMSFKLDPDYTPLRFFGDFFAAAEQEILRFFKDFELKGDKEKLLEGVVFELAAQCPLDWRKNGSR